MSELNISAVGSKGGDSTFQKGTARGQRQEHGIVLGIVKSNSHPSRSGILNVFVPEFGTTGVSGGKKLESDSSQWRQVQYATPFYSRTETIGDANNALSVKNTAGFVYPCPDIGTTVLCFFPHGNDDNGFWFAAVPDTYMLQALPESSTSDNLEPNAIGLTRGKKGPALDYNDLVESGNKNAVGDFLKQKRPLDFFTAQHLKVQGLDQDELRGLSTSSYTRETPSELIGLTSKGRRVDSNTRDLTSSPTVKSALENDAGTISDPELLTLPKYRRKGHSFVLDDGDVDGKSNLIKLKTSKGHQIILDDTTGFLYINNSNGTAWIEMAPNGLTDVYSAQSVTVRSRDINFHADNNIKFHAKNQMQFVAENYMHVEGSKLLNMYSDGNAFLFGGRGIDAKSGGSANLEGSATVNVKGGSSVNIDGGCVSLGSGAGPAAKQNRASEKALQDTQQDSQGFWIGNKVTSSTVDRLTTHEPFPYHGEVSQSTNAVVSPVVNNTSQYNVGIREGTQPDVKDDGIIKTLSAFNAEEIDPTSFIKQPTAGTGIGKLGYKAVDAVLTGLTEKVGSAFKYTSVEPITNALGKYAFTAKDLISKGYVSPEVVYNKELDSPHVWKGKNGINNKFDFLNNSFEQENLIVQKAVDVYQECYNNGSIQKDDSTDFIGGMLTVALGIGANAAKKYREGGSLSEALVSGTTSFAIDNIDQEASSLFQKGLSAIAQVDPITEVPPGATRFTGTYNEKTQRLVNIKGQTYVVDIRPKTRRRTTFSDGDNDFGDPNSSVGGGGMDIGGEVGNPGDSTAGGGGSDVGGEGGDSGGGAGDSSGTGGT